MSTLLSHQHCSKDKLLSTDCATHFNYLNPKSERDWCSSNCQFLVLPVLLPILVTILLFILLCAHPMASQLILLPLSILWSILLSGILQLILLLIPLTFYDHCATPPFYLHSTVHSTVDSGMANPHFPSDLPHYSTVHSSAHSLHILLSILPPFYCHSTTRSTHSTFQSTVHCIVNSIQIHTKTSSIVSGCCKHLQRLYGDRFYCLFYCHLTAILQPILLLPPFYYMFYYTFTTIESRMQVEHVADPGESANLKKAVKSQFTVCSTAILLIF